MSALSRDDVLRLAREAGLAPSSQYLVLRDSQMAAVERFADLVAAAASDKARADYEREHCRHVVPLPDAIKVMIAEAVAAEREACANLAEEISDRHACCDNAGPAIVEAIRARGAE